MTDWKTIAAVVGTGATLGILGYMVLSGMEERLGDRIDAVNADLHTLRNGQTALLSASLNGRADLQERIAVVETQLSEHRAQHLPAE